MTDTHRPQAAANRVLLAATCGTFLTAFLGSSLNIALPAIEREFAASAVMLSWVTTAYLLTSAALLLVAGRLGDIFGRGRVFMLGLLTTTVFSGLAALAPSLPVLIALRVIQGSGAALTFANSVALISEAFPDKGRGRALGLSAGAAYLGISLGPVAGGALVHQFDWQAVFIVPLLLGALALAVTRRIRHHARPSTRVRIRFDYAGAVLSALFLASFVLGVTWLDAGPSGPILLVLGILGLALFARIERKAAAPLVNVTAFIANRMLFCSCLAALLSYSATFATGFLLSIWLQYVRGLAPHEAGLVLLAQPALQALLSPLFGHVSDRIDKRILTSSGMAITGIAVLWLALSAADCPLEQVLAALALSGIGFAMFSSPNTNAIMGSVEPRRYGTASALLALSRTSGQLFSMGIVTAIFALRFGEAPLTGLDHGTLFSGISLAFLVMAALMLPGLFFSLARNTNASVTRPPV